MSARVQLTAGKTTGKWPNPITGEEDSGNLWYEETLPSDTLLYAVLTGTKPKDGKGVVTDPEDVLCKVQDIFAQGPAKGGPFLQIGGNETVGQGWCRIAFFGDQS